MTSRSFYQSGAVSGVLIAIVMLSIAVVSLGGLSAWAYMSYSEQKTNVDAKIDRAVAQAEKKQVESDEAKFAEREKEPNREFAGPSDYGRLSFNYPKTWSVYVAADGNNGGDYQAYLHPVVVPSVDSNARYALRVTITDQAYGNVLSDYEGLVESGDLKSSNITSNGLAGTRFDGKFSDDIRGAAVLYKIRDKTAILQTDADTFKPDFDKLIKTVTFNK